jgi:hypothetical protein
MVGRYCLIPLPRKWLPPNWVHNSGFRPHAAIYWQRQEFQFAQQSQIWFLLKSSVFKDVTPCSPLKVNWHFRGICHLPLQGWRVSQTRNQHEELHGILSQKIELFRNTTLRTSNPTWLLSTSTELLRDEAHWQTWSHVSILCTSIPC